MKQLDKDEGRADTLGRGGSGSSLPAPTLIRAVDAADSAASPIDRADPGMVVSSTTSMPGAFPAAATKKTTPSDENNDNNGVAVDDDDAGTPSPSQAPPSTTLSPTITPLDDAPASSSTATSAAAAMSPHGNNGTGSFKVVIVGGGPGGLALAHMLHRAGIDWVVLERGSDVVVESGASVAIWPQNLRVLDQCGILSEAERLYIPMRDKYNLGPDGRVIAKSAMLARIGENHGYPWMLFHRRTLLDFLYHTLPGRETRVHVNKAVTGIESTRAGVRVRCEDGTSVQGSIVVGCDGVHSTVRRLMRDPATFPEAAAANTETKSSITGPLRTPDNAMSAVFYGIVGHFPRIESIPPESVWEVHDKGLCVQTLVGKDDAYFFVYKRIPGGPARGVPKYTREEMDALAAEISGRVICNDGLTFGQVWSARTRASMVNYEEGFEKNWHRGRIVLVSDACVKMTPNAAFGLNTGMQGMVELTNRLRKLLLNSSSSSAGKGKIAEEQQQQHQPTEAQISNVFAEYQRARERMAKNVCLFSNGYTRTVTWTNVGYRLIDRISPCIGGDEAMIDSLVAAIVKRSIVLDFADETDFREGRVPWRVGKVVVGAGGGTGRGKGDAEVVKEEKEAKVKENEDVDRGRDHYRDEEQGQGEGRGEGDGGEERMRKRDSFHAMGYGVPA